MAQERRSTVVTANHAQQIVQKLWNYFNPLRDDGLSYSDYKMMDERSRASIVPKGYA